MLSSSKITTANRPLEEGPDPLYNSHENQETYSENMSEHGSPTKGCPTVKREMPSRQNHLAIGADRGCVVPGVGIESSRAIKLVETLDIVAPPWLRCVGGGVLVCKGRRLGAPVEPDAPMENTGCGRGIMEVGGELNRGRVEGGGAVDMDEIEVVLLFWRCERLELVGVTNEAGAEGVECGTGVDGTMTKGSSPSITEAWPGVDGVEAIDEGAGGEVSPQVEGIDEGGTGGRLSRTTLRRMHNRSSQHNRLVSRWDQFTPNLYRGLFKVSYFSTEKS
ncbi:hypothetical protein M407DRAFT_231708 [Tulasnella calospora MUT 4182]|uniref:Uncharacterized protein n=1 Tax=Tulasnella calospora MUT 4182 TaxID=1051891 RepID=A0A0C3QX57_9AGAM|nr:hypothetical protein M407DRAFT_231708 [Tulasnella calospora MUT 4182]